jgi:hypothetical protein
VRAFVSRADTLEFRFISSTEGNVIRDAETSSIWDLREGISTAGRLQGTRLTEVKVLPAFWFAWSNFYPRTEVLDQKSRSVVASPVNEQDNLRDGSHDASDFTTIGVTGLGRSQLP